MNKDDLLKRLLETFKIEAEEQLQQLSSSLVELEKNPSVERKTDIIETVFRNAHSLKGAARAVNLTDVERICQSLESVFSAMKRNAIEFSSDLFDHLHRVADTLTALIFSPQDDTPANRQDQVFEVTDLLAQIEAGQAKKVQDANPPSEETVQVEPKVEVSESPISKPSVDNQYASSDTVRISTEKLDKILLQVEEMLALKFTARQRAEDIQAAGHDLESWKPAWTKVSPVLSKVGRELERNGKSGPLVCDAGALAKLTDFLHWTNDYITSIDYTLNELGKSTESDAYTLASMVDGLLNDVKTMLSLPFSTILEMFPKLVRDLSRDQDKMVDIEMRGGEINIDRRILEEIKNPLIHIIRNCIDHGIEKQEVREGMNKPREGMISISLSRVDSDKVEIGLTDDGAGIDIVKLKQASVKQGIIAQQEADTLTDVEALSLIFQSGITTSEFITDISGRGLGLAIVREKIEQLGGQVSVETRPQAGTTFRMILPLTLLTFRGVLIRVSEQVFMLPTINIDRVVRIHPDEIKTIENRETLSLDGEVVPLVRLDGVLELPHHDNGSDGVLAVILESGEQRVGFRIDEVENEQEVLVKTPGAPLSRIRNISGATVLGSGVVVPVLHTTDLLKSAIKGNRAVAMPVSAEAQADEKQKSVLVVEDSITSRMLLKNILESAGYTVKTAVDGIDGFTTLREGVFDLVVSDVDMPRMSGFDLTAKIRADRTHENVPVVLVTALESREDRERGIDVGASAYIVKRDFDQSNLLDVIRRLIS